MKITYLTLAAIAALTFAPIASQAADKEVQSARCSYPQCKTHEQVALSGRRFAQQQTAPRFETVSTAQTGQGGGITFFAGNR